MLNDYVRSYDRLTKRMQRQRRVERFMLLVVLPLALSFSLIALVLLAAGR